MSTAKLDTAKLDTAKLDTAKLDINPEKTKHIVGFSGGIDSQACARWVLNKYGAENTLLMNSNAGGNEHPLTVEFVEWYSNNVHPVLHVVSIIADIWKTPGFAETRGYDGAQVLDFPTMIEIKRRSPSRKAQFCTEILKLRPQKRVLDSWFGVGGQYEGWDYILYSGVRRDESQARKDQPLEQWSTYFDCLLRCPLVDWTKQECFDFVQQHNEPVNELYKLGFSRVGCAPCINSSREDIRNWYMRFPAMIDKIRSWEQRTGKTFFAPMVPGKYMNHIDEVVEWAMCDTGGKQSILPIFLEREPCESKFGLCE